MGDQVIFPRSFPQRTPLGVREKELGHQVGLSVDRGHDRYREGGPTRFVASGDERRDLDFESQAAAAHGRVTGDASWDPILDQSPGKPNVDRATGPVMSRMTWSGAWTKFCRRPHAAMPNSRVCLGPM